MPSVHNPIHNKPNSVAVFPFSADTHDDIDVLHPADVDMLIVVASLPTGAAATGVLVADDVVSSSADPVIVEPFAGRVGPPNTPDMKCPSVVFEVGVPVPFLPLFASIRTAGDN